MATNSRSQAFPVFARPHVFGGGVAALLFAGALLLYGNAQSVLERSFGVDDWALTIMAGVALFLTLRCASTRSLTRDEIGLQSEGLGRGALLGAALGVVLALPVVLYFAFPFGAPGGTIGYARTEQVTTQSFLAWALVSQPIGVSLFEETMFRGVLQSLSIRAYGVRRGVFFTVVTFLFWHTAINLYTIQETSFAENIGFTLLAHAGSLVGLAVAGVTFSLLRLRTGGLAAPIAFHWTIVMALHLTLLAVG